VKVEPSEILVAQVGGRQAGLASTDPRAAILANWWKRHEGVQQGARDPGHGIPRPDERQEAGVAAGLFAPDRVRASGRITIAAETQTKVVISGYNKEQVGQVAAIIRDFRPPEPYKGKGIRYAGEYVPSQGGQGGRRPKTAA